MDKKALLKLADYLETVPRKRFDMMSWFIGPIKWKPTRNNFNCGTSACIAGHAATLFPRRLGIRATDEGAAFLVPYNKKNGSEGVSAFARAFNINRSLSQLLCNSCTIKTPKQAARAIRKIVSGASA